MNQYLGPFIEEDDLYRDIQPFKHRDKKLKKGTVLYSDDMEDTIICVNKGKLKLVVGDEAGEETVIHYINEKSICCPFLPVVVDLLSIKLIVEDDCELAYFDKSEFFNYMRSDGAFEKFIKAVGKRNAIVYSSILNILYETSKNRVYSFVYQMALNSKKDNEESVIQINNFPSKRDISLTTGVHRSNVYKYITDLENMGIIEKIKHGLLVKDIERLRTLIREGSNPDM